MKDELVSRNLKIFRFSLALGLLVFGLINAEVFSSIPTKDLKWSWIGIGLYVVPLTGQFIANTLVRSLTLWFGIFLVLQTVLTPLIPNNKGTYITLSPNKDFRLNVVHGAIPGIEGIQHITTDELGFRVQPKINYAENIGPRIFAIGGSTTEEIYIDDEATWTHLLQTRLSTALGQPVQVINTGVSGLRAVHHLATLKMVHKYQPDLAVILLGVNDWNRAIRYGINKEIDEYKVPKLPNTLLGNAIKNFYINTVKESKITSLIGGNLIHEEHGNSYNRRRGSLRRNKKIEYAPEQVSEFYLSDLKALVEECKSGPTKCLLLTQPNGYQEGVSEEYKDSLWMTPPGSDLTLDFKSVIYVANLYNNFLIDYGESNNISVFDLARNIKPGFESFHDDVHFNTSGSAEVAKELANYLLSENLIN